MVTPIINTLGNCRHPTSWNFLFLIIRSRLLPKPTPPTLCVSSGVTTFPDVQTGRDGGLRDLPAIPPYCTLIPTPAIGLWLVLASRVGTGDLMPLPFTSPLCRPPPDILTGAGCKRVGGRDRLALLPPSVATSISAGTEATPRRPSTPSSTSSNEPEPWG
ncbi:Hypothetical predicted protein [Pelobates cultripes]|uniref:Uncharacterized protein n=1 Tax=Pelobates cultripes TaxID=61616 RepID=A0AAD1VLB3_PELCU|nr:Hypothetical predicted protein [Pelobates cultripes]